MAHITAHALMAIPSISGRNFTQMRDAWTLMNAGKTTLDMTAMKTPRAPIQKAVSHVNVRMGILVMASHVMSNVTKVLLKSKANAKILTNVMLGLPIVANMESVKTLLVASYATANKDTK